MPKPVPGRANLRPGLIGHQVRGIVPEAHRSFANTFETALHGVTGPAIQRKCLTINVAEISLDPLAVLNDVLEERFPRIKRHEGALATRAPENPKARSVPGRAVQAAQGCSTPAVPKRQTQKVRAARTDSAEPPHRHRCLVVPRHARRSRTTRCPRCQPHAILPHARGASGVYDLGAPRDRSPRSHATLNTFMTSSPR